MIVPPELGLVAFLQTMLLGSFGTPFFIFTARWLVFAVLGVSLFSWGLEQEPNHRHAWKEITWSVLLAFVLALAFAALFSRVRPFVADSGLILRWIPVPSSQYSFPSTHSAVIWAWAAGVTRLERRAAPVWAVVAMLVALGRVVVGVHYVSDVMAGAFLGVCCTWLVRRGHVLLRRAPSLAI